MCWRSRVGTWASRRMVIRNRVRSKLHKRALEDRIALLDAVAAYATDSADMALTRREALERLARLDEKHREALLLVSWDGLTLDEAATVLALKPATFRKRLSRARELLDRDEHPPARTERPALIPTPVLSQETS